MELQWPLILFTTLLAWSAGTFAAQGIYAVRKEARSAQMPALVASLVLLVVGGIAVFFHLQHWERIFSGFGHMSSGITQELIAIVAMFIVMVVYFVMLRRSGDGTVPAWCGILAAVVALVLVVVMGHSYMMESRPAWNSVLAVFSLVGAACAFGPATVALLDKADGDASPLNGPLNIAGTALNLLGTVGFGAALAGVGNAVTKVDYTFDPTQPEAGIPDFSGLSPLAGGNTAPFLAAVVLAALALAFAFMGRKNGNWKLYGALIAVCVLVAAICLRMVFYQMGSSVFGYY